MQLSDRRAIVTGAAGGMGRATAERFAAAGAAVAVVDIDADGATATAAAITDAGGEAMALPCDVGDPAAMQEMVTAVVDAFGGLDILHNNAGIPMEATPIDEVELSTWERMLRVNATGVFLGSRCAVPHLRESEAGVIINTASTAALRPRPGLSAYVAAKGAVVALTKQLALELAPAGIRVNAIAPVATDTEMLDAFTSATLAREEFAASIPLGRLATPADIAAAALYLAGDDAQMVTGTVLEVDGGRDL
ncbi:MAG: SDR family oxidoreductase [Haloquadratum sp.]|nr:SDR family oxidoreductase [Haloferacaceae archaeon]MDR9445076.1 SDR family oxidoreductase [Haloquadratum sp.]